MKCPSCPFHDIPDGAEVCPSCGLDMTPLNRIRELPVSMIERASAAAEKGDLKGAIRIVEASTVLDGKLVESWILLGRLLIKDGQNERARDALEKALELDGANAEAAKLLEQTRKSAKKVRRKSYAAIALAALFGVFLSTVLSFHGLFLNEPEPASDNFVLSNLTSGNNYYFSLKNDGAQSESPVLSVLAAGPVPTTIEMVPNIINSGSQGKSIIAYIFLGGEYDVRNIDVSTVVLEGDIPAKKFPVETGDEEGKQFLMVEFDRAPVLSRLSAGQTAKIKVSGALKDGTRFAGTTSIRVI